MAVGRREEAAGMFTIVAGTDPQVLVVRVEGELDITSVDARRSDLDRAIHDHLERVSTAVGGPSLVVIDLRSVTILSAAGLHMLGELAVGLGQQWISTAVAVQPESIARRLLYLAGLDQRLVVLDAPLPG